MRTGEREAHNEGCELLAILRAIPAEQSLTEDEISDRLSWWVGDVFRTTASLLSAGEPICFSSWTGWYDPAAPEERVEFWYTRDPKD